MTSSVDGPIWSNLMKDGTDFSDQSSVIFNLWNKYQKSKNELDQVNQLCQSYLEIKQSINSSTTVQELEQICKQHKSHKWVGEFLQNLSNCTTSPTATELDPEKANAILMARFDKSFLNSFGIQMLFYSLHSLFQSYRAWNLVNSLHMPSYENQIRRTREKLDECAIICNPLMDLPVLNQEQIGRLHRVQELLRDIKDAIQFMIEDIKNKIAQARKYRSSNYISALMNFFSTMLNAILWDRIGKATGENSRSSVTTGISTLVQAGCTLGDLIHAGKANDFVNSLQEILHVMTDLEDRQQRLSIQVTNKLTNIGI
jgi:phospholipid N-methyltransferase